MSTGSPRHTATLTAHYYRSLLPGLSCATLIDGGAPRARVHDRHVLFAITSGEAVAWCRGQTHYLSPGSVLWIEPGDVHRDVTKTPYRAALAMVDAELVTAMCGAEARQVLRSSLVRGPALTAATVALVEAVRTQQPPAVQAERLARTFTLLGPRATRQPLRPEPALVTRARRALTEAPTAVLSLAELAGRLGCASTYLCSVYSQHVGLGPHAHQLQHRLLEARLWIERGETLATAASRAGFVDESHLSRHFRRRFATAPGRYRRELAHAADTPPGARAEPPPPAKLRDGR
jgi:AraC-like DNA-binding protein